MRVVSLLASGTEIVCALGAGDMLVGRSHECDNPAWVRRLPVCSAPTFDVSVSSRAIDAEVNRRIRLGEPLYWLDSELIARLQPSLLITQAHCEVCAVTPGDMERSGCTQPAVNVLALTAGTLEGIFDGIGRVAAALGLEYEGCALVLRERRRLAAVTKQTAGRRRPSVVLLEWIDPIFAMGNWGPELVEIANGDLLLGRVGQHSTAIAWSAVVEADPELLIVAPCGFDLKRTLGERHVLEALPGWESLRAVREGNVAYADGNLLFNRSGMTVSRTAEVLAEMLHGVVSGDAGEGTEWCWACDAVVEAQSVR